MSSGKIAIIVLLSAPLACSTGNGPPDAPASTDGSNAIDGDTADAGEVEADAAADVGATDATDAGETDAGDTDAGETDTGATTPELIPISVNVRGEKADRDVGPLAISGDGRVVAYLSQASNL